ncbi:MAG: hypothetical protein A2289_21590 [Deltaproteobacteria bacterium RIFOXYA12_FULL_58_15]|nr:MAG: hypothetical protein A2289_21590 [Deltaproteobacteria bacterium RIFOXYA12_FULL_58_15]OGR15006.1 MAG: hypothetical protein A2341_17850 [Deltaproteobacteria bacterium RIFOXYB12_FULL_58_9]
MNVQQAIDEANRCLLCHDAPCSQACPGGTDPAKFIRQIRFMNLKGAARTVLGNNPLGGVCANVCPTDDTCVRACLRSGIGQPIDIDGLQRFAVDYGRSQGVKAFAKGKELPHKVAVIGAGPAGLTAAARLATYGYPVTIFEARKQAGGMLRYGVPETRLTVEDLETDLNEITALGVEIRTNTRIESKNAAAKLLDEGYSAVFVAPGLWKPLALNIPGADLDGVTTALTFLDDARVAPETIRTLVKDQFVAIIGGGSVAMDVATTAIRLGAKRVYALALEGMTELPAMGDEIIEAMELGVVIKPQAQVSKVLGENGRVVGIEGHETEWVVPGKLTPDNAKKVDGTRFSLKVGALVQAIGQGATEAVGGIITPFKSDRGLATADKQSQATTMKKVFAGGDVVRGAGTVVDAVGDGKRAAEAIHELLSEGQVAL